MSILQIVYGFVNARRTCVMNDSFIEQLWFIICLSSNCSRYHPDQPELNTMSLNNDMKAENDYKFVLLVWRYLYKWPKEVVLAFLGLWCLICSSLYFAWEKETRIMYNVFIFVHTTKLCYINSNNDKVSELKEVV